MVNRLFNFVKQRMMPFFLFWIALFAALLLPFGPYSLLGAMLLFLLFVMITKNLNVFVSIVGGLAYSFLIPTVFAVTATFFSAVDFSIILEGTISSIVSSRLLIIFGLPTLLGIAVAVFLKLNGQK